jgi:hypothetical protein
VQPDSKAPKGSSLALLSGFFLSFRPWDLMARINPWDKAECQNVRQSNENADRIHPNAFLI